MDLDTSGIENAEMLEIGARCIALFELFDDVPPPQPANDDMYENLYPNIS